MHVEVKIDKLNLSSKRGLDIFYPMKKLPIFKFPKYIIKNGKKWKNYKKIKKKHRSILKYLNIIKYRDPNTGNILIICNQRKSKYRMARPLYLIFYPCFPNPVKYSHVKTIEDFFYKECGVKLCISIAHLAVDFIEEDNDKLFRQVINSIKPGFKREPYCSYPFSRYFGEPTSSNQIIVYNKSRQLKKIKKVIIPNERVRIELRLKAWRTRSFPLTTNELASYNWSDVVSRHFSFHIPNSKFMIQVNMAGESWRRPIWSLRDLASDLFEMNPSNFYRDCLMEHPEFSQKVRDILSNFCWAKA